MNQHVDDLEVALAHTGAIIEATDGKDRDRPTPCEEWNVQQVIDHLLVGLGLYTEAFDADQTPVEGDSVVRFHELGRRFVDAARSRPAESGPVTVPFGVVPVSVALQLGVVELLVHGWDIAVATQQHVEADEGVTQRALEFSRVALAQLPADRSPFHASIEVADSASTLEQLVALLGRSPR